MHDTVNRLRTFARASRHPLSVPGLLARAVILSCVFLVMHAAGFRQYTSFLCGMDPGVDGNAKLLALLGFLYAIFYLAFMMIVPGLLLAAGLLHIWSRQEAADRQAG